MIEKILVYERDAFFALNGSHYEFLDRFMWLFSGKIIWLPLAVFILCVLVYKKNWRESLLILLAITLTITLCDQFASHICKPYFMRFRPTHHPDFMYQVKTVFDYRGGMYGFISSHAANAFGFATLMSFVMRKRLFTWTIFFWATLNSYIRIYLGVHFISDVVAGALSGFVFGYLVYQLYKWLRNRWLGESLAQQPVYSEKRIRLIVYAIAITIVAIMILNVPLTCWLHN